MPRTALRRGVAATLAVGLLGALTACTADSSATNSNSATDPPSSPSQDAASQDQPADSSDPSTGVAAAEISPFQRELGGLFTAVVGEQEADVVATKNRIEDLKAACMAEQGFEYIPLDYGALAGGDQVNLQQSMSALEFAQQYGYGLSTYDLMASATESTEFVDPNAAGVEAMSEAERHAWRVAMEGEYEANGEAVPEGTPTEERGCSFQASEAILPDEEIDPEAIDAIYQDPRFTELLDAMWVEQDPGYLGVMGAIESEWSECMAGAGYPDLEAPYAAEELAMSHQGEFYTYDEEGNAITEPSPAALTEVRKFEIALATADATCQGDIDYSGRQQSARFEAEQRILDANREDVEALKAAIAQAEAN